MGMPFKCGRCEPKILNLPSGQSWYCEHQHVRVLMRPDGSRTFRFDPEHAPKQNMTMASTFDSR